MADFEYSPPFAAVVDNDASTFTRTFEHRDWVDGQDVVQAGATPDEQGMNARLNALETDLDAVKADLVRSFQLISELRAQLAVALTQIQSELNSKTDKLKEGKDTKDGKETKETKDAKDGKETKETKDGKETKETKDTKDGKETKETKELKDTKEGIGAIEKQLDTPLLTPPFSETPISAAEGTGRAFIRAEERPRVGERLLAREPDWPAP